MSESASSSGSGSKRQHKPVANAEVTNHLEALIARPITDIDALRAAAVHIALTEELALALLNRRDLPATIIGDLANNGRVMKHRKVRTAVVQHQRTPRHVSLPLVRRLYTFELMHVAIAPGVPTDVKMASEDALLSRFGTISAGEKLTLGRRGSARVAAGLLNDPDHRVVESALNNPFLTEIWVVKALLRPEPSQILAHHVCRHEKWSVRKDVRAALLRNEYTPLAHAIVFAQSFSLPMLKEIFQQSDLPANIKEYLLEEAEKRRAKLADSGKNSVSLPPASD